MRRYEREMADKAELEAVNKGQASFPCGAENKMIKKRNKILFAIVCIAIVHFCCAFVWQWYFENHAIRPGQGSSKASHALWAVIIDGLVMKTPVFSTVYWFLPYWECNLSPSLILRWQLLNSVAFATLATLLFTTIRNLRNACTMRWKGTTNPSMRRR